MIELNTKSAVITGSSRGIGEAIAIEFAKAGYNLVINSRDQEELSISKEEIIRAAGHYTSCYFSRGHQRRRSLHRHHRYCCAGVRNG